MKLLSIITLILSFSLFSASAKRKLSKLEFLSLTKKIVNDFQAQQFKQEKLAPIRSILDQEFDNGYKECVQDCADIHGKPRRPTKSECMKFVCSNLGTFDCDSRDEIDEVAKVCTGVRGSSCMQFTCSQLGAFDCNSISELREIAKSCRGVRNNECSRFICGQLGIFDCDSADELNEVANICRNVDDRDCLEYTCSKLGAFDCNSLDELEAVAKTCAGR